MWTQHIKTQRQLYDCFGDGVKCQGSGPSGTKRREKDYHSQSKRASEYADVLLQESTSNDGEKRLNEELLVIILCSQYANINLNPSPISNQIGVKGVRVKIYIRVLRTWNYYRTFTKN